MEDTPLIFLSFANAPEAELFFLKEESRLLNKALQDLHDKKHIEVYRDESSQVKDIYDSFVRHKNRVCIYHYGGHANGTHLKLEAGDGDASGLATLIGEQKNLKLVFLNGCSTKAQVETLMNAGVKAIIATSKSIGDQKAVEFSQQFYEALAKKSSIGQAFKIASSLLTTRYGSGANQTYRDIVVNFSDLLNGKESKSGKLPWGLYIKEAFRKDILNWKLPYYQKIGLPKEMIFYIKEHFKANRYLIRVLSDLCKFNPDIYSNMIEQRGGKTIKKDPREYPDLIIKNFPWPIGSQIRSLWYEDYKKANLQRLKHLVSTYIISSQVIYYILLSNLWENKQNSHQKIAWDYLGMDKHTFTQFDFFAQILPLYEKVANSGLVFLTELEQLVKLLKKEESKINMAHQYLETIRKSINEEATFDKINETCLKAEEHLTIFLRQIAFLSAYKMLTIRNIAIERTRFKKPEYDLEMGSLNGTSNRNISLYESEQFRKKSTFADSSSVVLVANEEQLDQSLNLSPFIVDKNTFVQVTKSKMAQTNGPPDIFMLGWEAPNNRNSNKSTSEFTSYYFAIKHSFFDAINKESDIINTSMGLKYFTEGWNLHTEEEQEEEDEFDMNFNDKLVFELLQEQYDAFKIDLIKE